MAGLQHGKADAALLDLNLAGLSSAPIAKRLAELHIPFIVMTEYGTAMIADDLIGAAPMVPKPFDESVLLSQLTVVFGITV